MKENIQIQIYILSRDRPNFIKEAIDSVLNQNDSLMKFEIIISDNSKSDDVCKMIDRDYTQKNLKYIRRDSHLSFEHHCQLIASELSTKYAVLFHDDDILHPDYMEVMSSFLENNNIASVGCNAIVFENNILNAQIKMHNFLSPKWFNDEKDFLEKYLPGGSGIAPCPGYMYRTEYLKQVLLNIPIKGKHADVAILSSMLKYGSIVWLEKTLMYYREHNSNLSVLESIPNRLSLLNYMNKNGMEEYSTKLLLFRINFWLRWASQQEGGVLNITRWRYRVVILSVFLKIMKAAMTRDFWKIIYFRYKN